MKKILFVAMAATMFAACTQNEELENAASNKEMKFNTAVMSTTRATATTSANFNTFKLYAYTGTNNATTIIDGITFNSSDKGTTWTPGDNNKFYWPGTETVSFYGYSVDGMDGITFDKSANSFSYGVAATIADQKDLLVAQADAAANTNNGTVSLSFEHALTKIAFKVQGEGASDLSYTVSKIAIEALPEGTYKYGESKGWTATGTKTTYTIEESTTMNGGETEKAIEGTDGNATLMLIPQEGAKITVTYSIKKGETIVLPETPKEFTIAESWTPGQNLSYLIKLDGAKEITVKASLAKTWDQAPENDTTLETPKEETPTE